MKLLLRTSKLTKVIEFTPPTTAEIQDFLSHIPANMFGDGYDITARDRLEIEHVLVHDITRSSDGRILFARVLPMN